MLFRSVEATYTVDVGFPWFVPKAFVDMLTGTQLPSMMKAFEDEAKKRMKGGGKKSEKKEKASSKGKKK